MAAKVTKLSKTQVAAWDRIRHALPAVFGEMFSVSGGSAIGCYGKGYDYTPGEYFLGENLTATTEKLQSAGYIQVTHVGGRGSDRGFITADRGVRVAVFGPVEVFDGKVCPFFTVSVETREGWNKNFNNGKHYHQFSGKAIYTRDAAAVAETVRLRAAAMDALRADGWTVSEKE